MFKYRQHHNSIDSALLELSKPEPDDSVSAGGETDWDWDLNTDYDRALGLARSGWKEIGDEIDKLLRSLQLDVDKDDIKYHFDVSGEEIDVSRYLAGDPECYLDPRLTDGGKLGTRVINLWLKVGDNCSTDATTLKNRGMYYATLVRALEQSGKSVGVTLYVACQSRNTNAKTLTTIRIKKPCEHLDPNTLAFWIAHPAAFRRIIFRLWELLPDETRDEMGFRDGHGYGGSYKLGEIPEDLAADAILLNEAPDTAITTKNAHKLLLADMEVCGLSEEKFRAVQSC